MLSIEIGLIDWDSEVVRGKKFMQQETNPPLSKLACVMVGLPARGKTYIARKVCRYLSWLGHRSRIFNVGISEFILGNYRRQKVGARQSSSFFSPDNPELTRQRDELANDALNDMIRWMLLEGEESTPQFASLDPDQDFLIHGILGLKKRQRALITFEKDEDVSPQIACSQIIHWRTRRRGKILHCSL